MRRVPRAQRWAIGAALLLLGAFGAAADGAHTDAARIEARSNDLLAVGLVSGDKMILHLSRLIDNSPVRDALVKVVLRGTTRDAVAEADGSYSLQTPDLALPGAAAVELQIVEGPLQESLKGTLDVAGTAPKTDDSGNARQLWWWVLNFSVCLGFLWLWSRRRKTTEED